jgi:hypothetical protein
MNPPAAPRRESKEGDVIAPPNMVKDVARCSVSLRQMYTLDLRIWGMKDCILDEVPQRQALERRANAMFGEIRRILDAWNSASVESWSVEEQALIREISEAVSRHNTKRYG